MVDCSEKLRKLREARKLTQAQVADRVGVSKTMISAYETASKSPLYRGVNPPLSAVWSQC